MIEVNVRTKNERCDIIVSRAYVYQISLGGQRKRVQEDLKIKLTQAKDHLPTIETQPPGPPPNHFFFIEPTTRTSYLTDGEARAHAKSTGTSQHGGSNGKHRELHVGSDVNLIDNFQIMYWPELADHYLSTTSPFVEAPFLVSVLTSSYVLVLPPREYVCRKDTKTGV